jgi:hypothetical protein
VKCANPAALLAISGTEYRFLIKVAVAAMPQRLAICSGSLNKS